MNHFLVTLSFTFSSWSFSYYMTSRSRFMGQQYFIGCRFIIASNFYYFIQPFSILSFSSLFIFLAFLGSSSRSCSHLHDAFSNSDYFWTYQPSNSFWEVDSGFLAYFIPFRIISCIIAHVMQSWHTIIHPLIHGVMTILPSSILLFNVNVIYSFAEAVIYLIYVIRELPLIVMITFSVSLNAFSSCYSWFTLLIAIIIGLVLSFSPLVVSNNSLSSVIAYYLISLLKVALAV